MNIDNWNYLYKIANGRMGETNMMYTPLVSPDETIMCMYWNERSDYLKHNPLASKELIDSFFEKEKNNIRFFQKFSWCPELLEINERQKKIFIRWNNNTLNRILFSDNNYSLNDICPDWKFQIYKILYDIKQEGYLKLALYPHCFYLDNNNKIKTFDFYSCIKIDQSLIEISKIEGLISPFSVDRFERATIGNHIDFNIFFKDTMLNYLGTYWNDNPFPKFYQEIFQ